MKYKTFDLRIKYYTNSAIRTLLYHMMKGREVITIDRNEPLHCVRGIRFPNPEYFGNNFIKFIGLYEKDLNFYMSVGEYDFIPPFTYMLNQRSKETREWFKEKAFNHITKFDLFFDFDCKKDKKENREDFLDEVEAFYYLLFDNKVCFYCMFSGSGYHFIIPSWVWGFEKVNEKIIKKALNLIDDLDSILDLKYLDTMGCGRFNKIRKVPYSICGNKVCLPINKWNRNQDFSLEFVYKNFREIINDTFSYKSKDGLYMKNKINPEKDRYNFQRFLERNFLK